MPVDPLEEWRALWTEFYGLKDAQAAVNVKLVQCKERLRSAGIQPQQPLQRDLVQPTEKG